MSMSKSESQIPAWLKLAYTAFMATLVPVYWANYGPLNFLWFCDVALLLALIAIWTESALPAGMAAIGIVAPQLLWLVDFFDRLLTGQHHLLDLSGYMFDPKLPLFLRGLSLFHGWIPLLLLWLLTRLGYDRRAIRWQPVVAAGVLTLSFLLVHDPQGPAGNVNKIFGPNDHSIQTMMPGWAWAATLAAIHIALIQLPSHLILRLVIKSPRIVTHGLC